VSDERDGPGASFEHLVELIARLRGPGGCPWDREQTHESLKPMTLEEAYEVVEAIDGGDDQLAGELGDLLLQVVFHSQIAREGARFDIGDVIEHVSRKMIRRHPHVFGDESASSSEEVLRSWEEIKRNERGAGAGESMLESVSRVHPAVMEAFQMSTKVSRVGFDWPGVDGALGKLGEELGELRAALSTAESDRRVEEEVGDLLFAAVNVARLAGVDPESALKAANRKFRRRFAHVEARLRDRGSSPGDSSLDEMEEFWADAKARGL
jgi:MazG family protein